MKDLIAIGVLVIVIAMLAVHFSRLFRAVKGRKLSRDRTTENLLSLGAITLVLVVGLLAALLQSGETVFEGLTIEFLGAGMTGVLLYMIGRDGDDGTQELLSEIRELKEQVAALENRLDSGKK